MSNSIDVEKVGIVQRWVETNTDHLMRINKDADKIETEDFLWDIVKNNIKNPDAKLTNSHVNKEMKTNLLSIVEWIEKKNPILTGFGCLFQTHHEQISPNSIMLKNFMDTRVLLKEERDRHDPRSFEYSDLDQGQNNEKTNVNSYYGCSGAPSSRFFNLSVAAATTLTGQSLISTSAQAFEAFLVNNVLFYDLDNCMDFLKNILSENRTIESDFLETPTVEAVFSRLKGMFYNYKKEYDGILLSYLLNLDYEDLRRIYYKNNLYEFTKNKIIHEMLMAMFNKVSVFLDPNNVPPEIEKDLDDIWTYYREFVFYNHSPFGRIQRLRHHMGRKAVVVVDTDSNMVDVDPWVEYSWENFAPHSKHIQSLDKEQYEYITINTISYLLTRMIREVLAKYTERANVPEEYRSSIDMKNEYLFIKMLIGLKKKRYITLTKLKEGVEYDPPKVSITGFDFIKSTTRAESREKFLDIINRRILNNDDPNTMDVIGSIQDLQDFIQFIEDSIRSGEKDFLSPAKAKSPLAYKFPLRERVVRGVIVWDAVHPHRRVENEEQVDLISVKMDKLEDIEDLQDSHPEIYEALRKNIYESPNKEIASKGINVIAIPNTAPKVPDWILPYADVQDMVAKNAAKFNAVLNSLNVGIVNMDNTSFYTNIKMIG